MGGSFIFRGMAIAVTAISFTSGAWAVTDTVYYGTEYQRIAGFGASTAWAGSIPDADAKILWDTTAGAGLSLHRIRIAPDGTTSETSIAKKPVSYGVKVWASPWSSNYTVQYGTDAGGNAMKHLDFSQAQNWANSILKFSQTMRAAGVPLYAISSQNEPDGTGDNHYSADSLALWVGSYLGPTLDTTGIKVMSPESMNWYGFPSYKTAIFNNSNALKYTSIIATHEYGGSVAAYPEIAKAGKEFWETEVYDLGSTAEDTGMTSALRVAGYIHTALTVSNVNAWHFWWVYPCSAASCGNGALWSQGSNSHATKRLWMMGNFSRFARPGSVRIGATSAPTAGVTVTAYRDSLKTRIIIVAINGNTSPTSQNFLFTGATPVSVVPYVTDSTRSLAAQAEQSVSSNAFTYSLPARSVTTFVCNLSAPVPQGAYSGTAAAIPGTIQAEDYDVGGEGTAYHDTTATNEGGVYRTDGVDVVSIADGYAVGYTIAGEWMEYTVNVAAAGKYVWSARVAAKNSGTGFHILIDDADVTGNIVIDSTDSWDTYKTISGMTASALAAGEHVLRFVVDGSYFNIDWFAFADSSTEKLAASPMKPFAGVYRVYGLNGAYIGSVNSAAGGSLSAAVSKIAPRGAYMLKNSSGAARLVNVK